jgi:hypothetical protein
VGKAELGGVEEEAGTPPEILFESFATEIERVGNDGVTDVF